MGLIVNRAGRLFTGTARFSFGRLRSAGRVAQRLHHPTAHDRPLVQLVYLLTVYRMQWQSSHRLNRWIPSSAITINREPSQ